MSQNAFAQSFLDPILLGSWIAQRRHIWQMDFLSPKELAKVAVNRGLSSYQEKHITHLWKLGLLKADLVISEQSLQEEGLVSVGQKDENTFLYADARNVPFFEDHSDIVLEEEQKLPLTLKLLFHPFRYAVLPLFEQFLPRWVPLRILLPGQYQTQEEMDRLLSRTPPAQQVVSSAQLRNDIVALLVATEPCFYQRIFQSLRITNLADQSQENNMDAMIDASFGILHTDIDQHWNDLVKQYHAIGLPRLEQLHQTSVFSRRCLTAIVMSIYFFDSGTRSSASVLRDD